MKSKSLVLFCLFSFSLSLFRVYYSGNWSFIFLNWNLFLATVPLIFARLMEKKAYSGTRFWALFIGWFLFFPNSPYIVTDLFYLNRYSHSWHVPIWFDLILISSFAINGLLLGFVSAQKIVKQLRTKVSTQAAYIILSGSFMASGYGVYLGRFGRFNSWDIITQPQLLLIDISQTFLHPAEHIKVYALSLLFGVLVSLIFYSLHETVEQQH